MHLASCSIHARGYTKMSTNSHSYIFMYICIYIWSHICIYVYLSISTSILGPRFSCMGSLKTNRKWLPEGRHRRLGEKNVIKRDRKKKQNCTSLHHPLQNQLINDCLQPKLVCIPLALSSEKVPSFPYVMYEFNLKGNIIIWPIREEVPKIINSPKLVAQTVI